MTLYPRRTVDFPAVTLTDDFWAPRLEANRAVTVPHCLQMVEEAGLIENYRAAGERDPDAASAHIPAGLHLSDETVYKAVEAASYLLARAYDPALDAQLDAYVATIAAAQEPDGYLNTQKILKEPRGGRWNKLGRDLELYVAGHLYEAAVAHYSATGKRALLDVAIKNADLVDRLFGPGKRVDVGEHPEIELALIRLYEATGEDRYYRLARFFVDTRGTRAGGREMRGPFSQDHAPITAQTQAVGQAPRATYLYSGVTDVAAALSAGGEDATPLVTAMKRLWDDVVNTKLYITGGIGARHENEGFGEAYELPNLTGFTETCAAVSYMMWALRMWKLLGESQYLDVLERTLYNNFLAGVSLRGDTFFYACPPESDGTYPFNVGWIAQGYTDRFTTPCTERKSWFACACCPPNVARWLEQVPGFFYGTDADGVHVNLYGAGTARLTYREQKIEVRQATRYPWEGTVTLRIVPEQRAHFALTLRIPGWARGKPVPGDLYTYADPHAAEPSLYLNGNRVPATPTRGTIRLERAWEPGDRVELRLPLPVRRVVANPAVEADRGKVALQRGPLLYCVEGIDNRGRVRDLVLPDDSALTPEHRTGFLGTGSVTVLTGEALRDGLPVPIVAIPYALWGNRGAGEMATWLQRG